MKRMLINATQEEELRMAMVDGQRLYDLNIEAPSSERKKANIYKGRITRIEPSLEAAFVDYGAARHGFLPLKEISNEYFVKEPSGGKINIKDVLKEGQDIVVQVDKEERGNKGAALTTFVSLAGRFIVLKPNKARSGGVSRRITGDDRDLARQALNLIQVPDGMSVILRTAGIDRTAEELAWDLENLLTVWTAILNVVLERPSPFLIYRESDSVVRALRDYLTNDIGEILIDDEATYKDACEHVKQTMPHNLRKLKHYMDPVPLFTRFQIESQIESAFAHVVHLPSGGSIVIDHTEALVSIDINSARATKGGDIEATALNTNLEAAEEIARQLRIRDLGGLIVIDFIDMGPQKHQRDVENKLREAVRQDRARVQIGKISRFGLLEMSRQRLRPSIGESSHQTCPRCSGFGTIRSVESLALAILRIVGEEARKERTAKVIAQLPVEVATFLLNEKRDWVQSVEDRNETQIVLVANSLLETPHYEVRRVRDDQVELPENAGASYALAGSQPEPEAPQEILARKQIEQPAVGVLKPSRPAPKREPEEIRAPGFWSKIVSFFSGGDDDDRKSDRTRTQRKAATGDNQATRTRRASSKRGPDKRGTAERGGRKQPRKSAATKKAAGKKKKKAKEAIKDDKDIKASQDQAAGGPQQDKTADTSGDKRPRARRSRGGRRRRRGTPDKSEQATETRDTQQSDAGAVTAKADRKQDPEPAHKAESETRSGKSQDAEPAHKAESEAGSGKSQETQTSRQPVQDVKDAEPGRPKQPKQDRKPRRKAEPGPDATPEAKAPEAKAPEAKAPEKQGIGSAGDGNGQAAEPTREPRLLPWEPQKPVVAVPKQPDEMPRDEPQAASGSDRQTPPPDAGTSDRPADQGQD